MPTKKTAEQEKKGADAPKTAYPFVSRTIKVDAGVWADARTAAKKAKEPVRLYVQKAILERNTTNK